MTISSSFIKLMDKFDRQLRLWGNHGQHQLAEARICIVGQSLVSREVLKNLVLPGVTKFTLVAGQSEADEPLQFLTQDELKDINKEVELEKKSWNGKEMSSSRFWLEFDLVIIATNDIAILEQLRMIKLPPTLLCQWHEYQGFITFVSREPHYVLESHWQHRVPDLRLDDPPRNLAIYYDSIDLDQLSQDDIVEIPYAVIVHHALKSLKRRPARIDRRALQAEIRCLRDEYQPKVKSLNFMEAERLAYVGLQDSKILPNNVLSCFEASREGFVTPFNRTLQCLVKALQAYLEHPYSEKQLPVSGLVPDMESSSQRYNVIRQAYLKCARNDLTFFTSLVHAVEPNIPTSLISSFCKNSRYIRVVRPLNVLPNEDCSWLKDRSQATDTLKSITVSVYNKKATWSNEERLLRYRRHFPTCSFLAGVVAQEAVKILTHQFVPIENTLVYDGKTNEIQTINL